jgi:hypothetical protein
MAVQHDAIPFRSILRIRAACCKDEVSRRHRLSTDVTLGTVQKKKAAAGGFSGPGTAL